VVVYLGERNFPKGFIEILPATIVGPGAPAIAAGKPPGSVPLLTLPSGEVITESLSIIEYLEDAAESQRMQSMRGVDPVERAGVRTLLGLIETVTLSLEFAAVNGSVAFAPLVEGQQSPGLERWLFAFIHKNLGRIEEIADPRGPFLVKAEDGNARVTTADCALFATLQYASEMLGLDLVEEHPRMKLFFVAFEKRPSAAIPENTWTLEMKAVLRDFIEF
jgi:glutathione S-transferase